jgi:Beta-lactamase
VIVAGGRQVFARGYGVADVDRRKPVDPDTTEFFTGSVAMLFTAAAARQLVIRKLILRAAPWSSSSTTTTTARPRRGRATPASPTPPSVLSSTATSGPGSGPARASYTATRTRTRWRSLGPASTRPPASTCRVARNLVRDVDAVVDNYLSMSYAAPHLFGPDLAAFTSA